VNGEGTIKNLSLVTNRPGIGLKAVDMQDEVTKHTRKIFQEVKNREHGFWEKTREIVIEILIIVFAVTLSIWLHNWSDHRAEQKQTEEFLAGLRADLTKDLAMLEVDLKTFREEKSYFKYLLDANIQNTIDTISEARVVGHFYYQQVVTHPNIARYDGFKSSGKLGTIEDDSLRQMILAYYQQTMPGVNDLEEIENGLQVKLMDAQFTRSESMSIREFAKSRKALSYLELCIQNLEDGPNGTIPQYLIAQKQAREIIGKIDIYLKGRI
jgi:hypothetical protein